MMEAGLEDTHSGENWNELWVLAALDLNGIGSWDFDLSSNNARRTMAHDRIFGYTSPIKHWSFESFLAHVLSEDHELVNRSFQKSRAEKSDWGFECRIRRIDGETRWIFVAGRPVCDKSGSVHRFIGTVRDITQQKLMEKQLLEAQKLESVGQLTAGVSHYFNNLLAVMMMNIDALSSLPGMPREAEPLIATSLRAMERGASLTRQLLAFARKWALSPQVVDLGAELQHIETSLRRALPDTMQLTVDITPQPIPVLVDIGQLNVALTNLAVNARDATQSTGHVRVLVGIEDCGASNSAATGRYGVISVQDNGCGMPAHVVAKAFDPFFTTKEVGKGAGLGLSMVYGFMAQSQGRAELSSCEGEGTTVKLLFPLAVGQPKEVSAT